MDTTLIFLIVIGIVLLGAWSALFIGRRRLTSKQAPPFTQALTFLLNGEKEKALEKLRAVTRDDTDNIEAYILYGDILRDMGHFQGAAKVHKELTVRNKLKPDVRNDIYRSLILDYQGGKYYKQALEAAEELLANARNDTWALRQKLGILESMKEWKKAFETAKKFQSVNGKSDPGILALYKVMEGKKLLQQGGKEHDARLLFRAALKLDRKCTAAYLELAQSYIRESRPDDALKEWKALFENDPRHAYLAFVDFENTSFELGKFAELETIYNKLLRIDPGNSRTIVALARFLERKGEIHRAIEILREGLDSAPESIWIRRNLFRMLARENKCNEAIEVGLEVIEMVTTDKEDYLCSRCGYLADKPLWHCPKCHSWRSFRF